MCGICGQYNFGDGAHVLLNDIKAMTGTIVHRGPDDEGHHLDRSVGLGFRRLSIIDLAGGHQPMSDAEQTVWVIVNAWIDAGQDLRAERAGRELGFRTKSDSEAMVPGYKEWGTDVFDRLTGMFGIALWDARRRRLVLARDAMGIKLIYY